MEKIRISAVSYLNTLPFIYGMESDNDFMRLIELSRDIPSECARKLVQNEVDLGLVPVAIIPQIQSAEIVSNYCIGSQGAVHSVLLVSEVPLKEIKAVYLDFHSRTSVKLCQILLEHYWQKEVKYLAADENYIEKIKGSTAGVIIGDRTFNLDKRFKYQYDLAEAWTEWKNLPFVFAAWVSNKPMNVRFLNQFNQVLRYGLNHKKEALQKHESSLISKEKQLDYLEHSIHYELDSKKSAALDEFLSLF